MASPTRRDYLKCIRACNPKTKVQDPAYFSNAKQCLHKILPASSTTPDENFAHTSRLFVNKIREFWKLPKVGKNFNGLLKLSWFDEELVLKSPAPPMPALPSPPPDPPTTRQKSKSFDELGTRQKDRISAQIRQQFDSSAIGNCQFDIHLVH